MAVPGGSRADLRGRAARDVDRAGRPAGRAGPGGGVGGGGARRGHRVSRQRTGEDGAERPGRRPAHARRRAVAGGSRNRAGLRAGGPQGGRPAGRAGCAAHSADRCRDGRARLAGGATGGGADRADVRGPEHDRIPCAWVCWRFGPEHRVVALGLAGPVQALAILCLAVGYREPGLASLAVVLAALSSGGSVAFARFLERWL
ncbi:MAG: MrpF/PhaF family protein [Streptosporangiaceae bacterium]